MYDSGAQDIRTGEGYIRVITWKVEPTLRGSEITLRGA